MPSPLSRTQIAALLTEAGGGRSHNLLSAFRSEFLELADDTGRRSLAGASVASLVEPTLRRLLTGSSSASGMLFLGPAAARAMRQILVSNARRQLDLEVPHCVDQEELADASELIQLDQALRELAGLDRRLAAVIELRYFGGFSETEVAELLEMAPATVAYETHAARLWLKRSLA